MLQALNDKHPWAYPSPCFSCEDASWSASSNSVMEKATSFKSGSACGLDGFSPPYFKDINDLKVSDTVESYWASLAKLVNISKDGKLPLIFSDILGIAFNRFSMRKLQPNYSIILLLAFI